MNSALCVIPPFAELLPAPGLSFRPVVAGTGLPKNKKVAQLKSLQAVATLSLLADRSQYRVNQFGTSMCNALFRPIFAGTGLPKDEVNQFYTLGVMLFFRPVVGGTSLPRDEVNQTINQWTDMCKQATIHTHERHTHATHTHTSDTHTRDTHTHERHNTTIHYYN